MNDLSLLDMVLGGLIGGGVLFAVSYIRKIRGNPDLPSHKPEKPTYHKNIEITKKEKERIRNEIHKDTLRNLASRFNKRLKRRDK